MRRSHLVMGMGLSIDIPGCDDEAVYNEVFKRFTQIDERFSTYKPSSELARYRSGMLADDDLSDEIRKVMTACRKAEKLTDGFFSSWYDGTFEPSGYVKGWAVAEGGKVIENAGYKTYCLGAGGDILASSNSRKVWNIAIQNPVDKKYLTSQVILKNQAIATSGNYERGLHIINPKSGMPAKELLSVSVVGPNIITADILATACFAAGKNWQSVLSKHSGYKGLAIDKDGKTQVTKNWVF